MSMLSHEGIHIRLVLMTEQCPIFLQISHFHESLISREAKTEMLSGISPGNTLGKERERAVMMTTLGSFPPEPRGEEIHQPESQRYCMVAAAGISFAVCRSSQDEW